jgi:leader peptidase (prepilin peptidase)/N-methyltransferase
VIAGVPGWTLLVAVGAAGCGLPLRRVLQRLGYRTDAEAAAQPPGSRRWVAPVLGVVGWLLALRVHGEAGLGADARAVLLLTLVAFAVGCVALAAVDLDVHRLPDELVTACAAVLLAGFSVVGLLGAGGEPWWRAWACALASGAFYLLLALVSLLRGGWGVGLGDVKLSVPLGGALGWFGVENAVVGVYAGFLVGGTVAAMLLVTRRVSVRGHLAYGPPMMLGALLGVMLPAGSVTSLF